MKARVKFYSDTPRGEKNKLFTWKVNNQADALACIKRFQLQGHSIRAGFLELTSNDKTSTTSTQIFPI